jgi:hypothetical protein
LEAAWYGANKGTAHSWERLNHAMQDALRLAIGAGLKFEPGDWGRIASSFGFDRWIGAEGEERFYALAVQVGNMSAVKAMEDAWGRRPFIADRVKPGRALHGYLHGNDLTKRKRCRLAVGFEFQWETTEVTVTSFAPDDSYLTACSYRRDGGYDKCPVCVQPRRWPKSVLDRKFTITHADLRAAHRSAPEPAAEDA